MGEAEMKENNSNVKNLIVFYCVVNTYTALLNGKTAVNYTFSLNNIMDDRMKNII